MESLAEQVESRVREEAHDHIRDLSVEEEHGRVVVRGEAPTYYDKQLALHGALDVLPGERLDAEISVDGG